MLCPPLRYNAILTPSEKERGRKDIGSGHQGNETEQAMKTLKDQNEPTPTETITAPARTTGVTCEPPSAAREILPDTRSSNDVAGSRGLFDNPDKIPLPASSPGSDQNEGTTSSMFLHGFARCQKIDQINCSGSSTG
jgi:hypothetical protein